MRSPVPLPRLPTHLISSLEGLNIVEPHVPESARI